MRILKCLIIKNIDMPNFGFGVISVTWHNSVLYEEQYKR